MSNDDPLHEAAFRHLSVDHHHDDWWCTPLVAHPPHADVFDPFTTGYVWNDQPARQDCFAPSSSYSYNSTTVANSICRTGAGIYVVHFPGLAAPGGNAQVTTYGATPANCKV